MLGACATSEVYVIGLNPIQSRTTDHVIEIHGSEDKQKDSASLPPLASTPKVVEAEPALEVSRDATIGDSVAPSLGSDNALHYFLDEFQDVNDMEAE